MCKLSRVAMKLGRQAAKAAARASRPRRYRRHCRERAARLYRAWDGGIVTLSTFLLRRSAREPINAFSVLWRDGENGHRRYNFRAYEHAIAACEEIAAGTFKPAAYFGKFF